MSKNKYKDNQCSFHIPIRTKRVVWTVDGSQFQTGGYGDNYVEFSINLVFIFISKFKTDIQYITICTASILLNNIKYVI